MTESQKRGKDRKQSQGEEKSSSPNVVATSSPTREVDWNKTYPLKCSWTMFYNSASKGNNSKSWQPTSIMTFSSIEDFWRLFNNLVAPSKLPIGSNYHLFKNGIQPEWEDGANKNGGKWSVTYQTKGDDNNKKFDDAWLWIVLALIGEFFEDSDNITGVVISPRAKFNKIALWTSGAKHKAVQIRIGTMFKTNLNVTAQVPFQSWDDAKKDSRSPAMYNV